MTPFRIWLCSVVLPGILGLAALAAIVIPGGGDLTWPRLIAGLSVYAAIHIGGATAIALTLTKRP